MSAKNGDYAFPVTYPAAEKGMTLRDYFAAKMAAAYCSCPEWRSHTNQQITAQLSYEMADAMLAAREAK